MTSKDGKNHSLPTLNHKWAEDAFCHIVTIVFQKTLDSPLVTTLEEEGITDIFAMVTLCDQDIADIPLPISNKQLSTSIEIFTFTNSVMDILPMT